MGWWSGRRVTVTGGRGFLGRRLVAALQELGPSEISVFGSSEYDLTRQVDVERMYRDHKPDVVIHLAARVGGIGANQANPGRYLYDNAIMGLELMHKAEQFGVEKFVQLGTVCAYPKFTPVPFQETELWNGYPEETNAPYGVAKKLLLVQAQAYREQYGLNAIYLLPSNLYGPGDNFDPASSHVIPALIRKFGEAVASGSDEVVLWGTGQATREFLFVDDAVQGILLATERYSKPEPVNLGTSEEISIADLAGKIGRLSGFQGHLRWDATKPDGQPRRKLDTSRASLEFGFDSRVTLDAGLQQTIEWYRAQRPA